MRHAFLFLLLLSVLVTPFVALAADVPAPDGPKKIDVDIDVHSGDAGPVWYKNPIVIGIGVIAVLLVAILASRGGTTVVERH
jgi:hypothetical protein